VAVRLAQRGADVTLLDANTPGDGTTGSQLRMDRRESSFARTTRIRSTRTH
jgi:glycine/D-amino acid oxidase-like deaminating enzyme